MKKKIRLIAGLLFPVLVWISCRENIDDNQINLKTRGIYILNEGSFMAGTGDVSFFDPDSHRLTNNLFLAANGTPAGDILTDMLIADTLGILVVNNSNKIRVVNLNTFRLIKDISLTMPRRIVKAGMSKAYISCWNGTLQILDLSTMTITRSVTMPEDYPEGLWVLNNKVFVALSSGLDWGIVEGAHRWVAVVDALSDSVIGKVRVGYNPVEMAYDENNNRLYVACSGSEYTVPKVHGGIYIIHPVNLQLMDSIIRKPADTGVDTLYVSNLWIDGPYAYMINHFSGPITVFNIQTRIVSGTIPGNFYNVAIDAYHEKILATTMSANGQLKIYNANLELHGTLNVGEFPNGIIFRYSR